mmetsp:Transcript_66770/g.206804  ORF Transcript_66770/g.206804 Transcript_66770/m.206804 type:complete len:213 (-) Transcript_66770:441-1079(-)
MPACSLEYNSSRRFAMSSRFLALPSCELASRSILNTPFTCDNSCGAIGSPTTCPPTDESCTAWFCKATLLVVESFCCAFVGSGHGTGVPSTTGRAECCGAVDARGGPAGGGPAGPGTPMCVWPGGNTPGPAAGALKPFAGLPRPIPPMPGIGPMPGPGTLAAGPMPGPGMLGAGPMPGPGMPGAGPMQAAPGFGPMPRPGMPGLLWTFPAGM